MSETENCISILNNIANFINTNTKFENNLLSIYETVKNIKIIEMYIIKLEKKNTTLLEENKKIVTLYEKQNSEINNKLEEIVKSLKNK